MFINSSPGGASFCIDFCREIGNNYFSFCCRDLLQSWRRWSLWGPNQVLCWSEIQDGLWYSDTFLSSS